jgi:hypothetical protein
VYDKSSIPHHIGEWLAIGLCSIGDVLYSSIEDKFKLNDKQVLLHTIEGGLKI